MAMAMAIAMAMATATGWGGHMHNIHPSQCKGVHPKSAFFCKEIAKFTFVRRGLDVRGRLKRFQSVVSLGCWL